MGNSRSSRRNKTGTKITTQNARMNSVTQNTVCQSLSAPPVENPLPLSPLPSVPLPPTKKDRRPVNPVARSVQSRVPVWRNAHGDMISITTSHPIESTNDSSSDSSPRLTHNATPVHEHHRNPSPDHHHYHNQHATDLFSHHHHSDPLTSSQPSYTSTYFGSDLFLSARPLLLFLSTGHFSIYTARYLIFVSTRYVVVLSTGYLLVLNLLMSLCLLCQGHKRYIKPHM